MVGGASLFTLSSRKVGAQIFLQFVAKKSRENLPAYGNFSPHKISRKIAANLLGAMRTAAFDIDRLAITLYFLSISPFNLFSFPIIPSPSSIWRIKGM